MGLFDQFADIIEWQEYRDDVLFYKWSNREIKKDSRLIIKPGQDALFLYNGKIEGVFTEEGRYEVDSDIIPFLSTLKGFKFGFNSGLRAEVLFINTKEFTVKWGTKAAINLPAQGLPGGLPIRAYGTFACRVDEYQTLIDKIAGIKNIFTVDDVKERVIMVLDQLLMKWIAKEGKDMYNLQANAYDISKGICEDLDMEMRKIGLAVPSFSIASFTYPEEVQRSINRTASQGMVGDLERYTTISAADAMQNGKGGSTMADMAGLSMGMAMGQKMAQQFAQNTGTAPQGGMNYCPNCGQKTTGGNFCQNCGYKLK